VPTSRYSYPQLCNDHRCAQTVENTCFDGACADESPEEGGKEGGGEEDGEREEDEPADLPDAQSWRRWLVR